MLQTEYIFLKHSKGMSQGYFIYSSTLLSGLRSSKSGGGKRGTMCKYKSKGMEISQHSIH